MHELFDVGDYQLAVTSESLSAHHPALPRKTTAMCLDVGIFAQDVNMCWVKRQYLLARIANPRSLDCRRIALFQQLRAASQDLEALLEVNPLIECDLRAALSPSFSLVEGNARKEIGAFIVCEAALLFLNDRAILDHTKNLMPLNIEDADASYWLANVACWSGSLALLNYLEVRAPYLPVAESYINVSASKCLPTAIYRGHKEIIEHILRLKPLTVIEHVEYWPCPIQAAICAGDLSTINLMLGLVDTIPSRRRIYRALRMARPQDGRLEDYKAVVQRLLPVLTSLRPAELSFLTIHVADVSGSAGVDLLAESGLLSAHHVRLTAGYRSALDYPSRKGDVSTIKKLFEVGYFENNSLGATNVAISRAAKTALSWGHAKVFEELSKHSRKLDNAESIPYLAGADGTLCHLQDLAKPAEVLQAPANMDFCTEQDTIGQAALERAMQLLKPANVKYFLDMGIRLAHGREIVTISWAYSRRHQAALLVIQQMLAGQGLPTIELFV